MLKTGEENGNALLRTSLMNRGRVGQLPLMGGPGLTVLPQEPWWHHRGPSCLPFRLGALCPTVTGNTPDTNPLTLKGCLCWLCWNLTAGSRCDGGLVCSY